MQCVIVKIELLQSEQMSNFMWDFAIEAVVLEIDDPQEGEITDVR